jgi:hypothetical protein
MNYLYVNLFYYHNQNYMFFYYVSMVHHMSNHNYINLFHYLLDYKLGKNRRFFSNEHAFFVIELFKGWLM